MARARRGELKAPPGLTHQAIDDRQSEARSLHIAAGANETLRQYGELFGRHRWATIADLDLTPRRLDLNRLGRIPVKAGILEQVADSDAECVDVHRRTQICS